MEEKSLVKYEAKDGQEISLSFDTITKYLVQGRSEFVTRQEMMYFMGICKSRGLNPFAKDCYLIKYSQKEGAAIITAIDYFRKRAKAQRDCKGWKKGIIVERKGDIFYSDGLMLSDDVLLGGWFKAKPEGWDEPFLLEVNLKTYIKHKVDGSVTKFWSKENQPSQIAKVAESQGLRTLWPDEFQQLYTQEEMGEGEMFKTAEEIVKSDADTLNDKLKADKDKPKTNIYETKEPDKEEKEEKDEGEKEDQIRKLYKGLGDQAFAEFVSSHAEAIPGMEQVYQDEIRASWGKRAKKKDGLLEGDPYPLDPPEEGLAEGPWPCPKCGGDAWHRDGCPDKEAETEAEIEGETETENIIRLVEGARWTESGIAIKDCPNAPEHISVLRVKCDGIGMDGCKTREGCPLWVEYDKAHAANIEG